MLPITAYLGHPVRVHVRAGGRVCMCMSDNYHYI